MKSGEPADPVGASIPSFSCCWHRRASQGVSPAPLSAHAILPSCRRVMHRTQCPGSPQSSTATTPRSTAGERVSDRPSWFRRRSTIAGCTMRSRSSAGTRRSATRTSLASSDPRRSPHRPLVLLLQEVYRSGSEVPSTTRSTTAAFAGRLGSIAAGRRPAGDRGSRDDSLVWQSITCPRCAMAAKRQTRIAEMPSCRTCRLIGSASDRAAIRAAASRRDRGNRRRSHLIRTPVAHPVGLCASRQYGKREACVDWIGVRPRPPGSRPRGASSRRSTDDSRRRLQHLVRILPIRRIAKRRANFRRRGSPIGVRPFVACCGSITCSIGYRASGDSMFIGASRGSARITIRW